jgi:hypothetical protein
MYNTRILNSVTQWNAELSTLLHKHIRLVLSLLESDVHLLNTGLLCKRTHFRRPCLTSLILHDVKSSLYREFTNKIWRKMRLLASQYLSTCPSLVTLMRLNWLSWNLILRKFLPNFVYKFQRCLISPNNNEKFTWSLAWVSVRKSDCVRNPAWGIPTQRLLPWSV